MRDLGAADLGTTGSNRSHSLGPAYIALLVVGCAAVVLVAADLERRLPHGVNGVAIRRTQETVGA